MQEGFPLSKYEPTEKINLIDYDAILFDFDGVIADSEALHVSTKKAALDTFNIAYDNAQIMSFQGSPEIDFFDFFANQSQQDANTLLALKRQLFEQEINHIKPIEGVISFIRKLNQYKPCYVVTSSIRKQMNCFIERHELINDFKGYITCDDVSQHKPHPAPYLVSMAQSNLQAARCLVIEDSPNGISSAKAAGCFAVGLIGEFSSQELIDRGADVVVHDYLALESLLFD